MKTKINFLIIFSLCALSAVSQINVKTNGRVKIGQGSIAPVSQLEVQDVNHTTECRVFAASSNIARLWTMNQMYAIGLGVDEDGIPHIYTNVNAPFNSIDFGWNQFKFNFYNSTSINIENLSRMTVRPGVAHTGYLGTGTYPWAGIYSDNYLKYTPAGESASMELLTQDQDLVSKLNTLNGFKYTRTDADKSSNNSQSTGRSSDIGLSVNEVKETFPDLVVFDTLTNQYYIDYTSFIPILIEAYKSQQNQIQMLEDMVNALSENGTYNYEKDSTKLNDQSKLFQNSPNPFKEETKIRYIIDSKTSSASISIYNLSGEQIKSYRNLQNGRGEIIIKGSELKPGMYLYSLIGNNHEIDAKRMVLTD